MLQRGTLLICVSSKILSEDKVVLCWTLSFLALASKEIKGRGTELVLARLTRSCGARLTRSCGEHPGEAFHEQRYIGATHFGWQQPPLGIFSGFPGLAGQMLHRPRAFG